MRKIDRIVVHCAATPRDRDIGAVEIDAMHKRRGWSGIGYHFVIRRNGAVEAGRPVETPGAHAKGFNARSLGVCLVGGANSKGRGEDNFTWDQMNSLKLLLQGLRNRHPNTTITGHRDLSPDKNGDGKITSNEWLKECPSFEVSDFLKLNDIKQDTR